MFKRSQSRIDLNKVGIATPCTMDWNRMQGDERVRHCGDCKLNVFNVSELSKSEAEDLIALSLKGERVCVRLMRREDGTLITKDCPTGVRRVRRQRLGISAACAAAFALFFGVFNQRSRAEDATSPATAVTRPADGEWMGEIAVDPETVQQQQQQTQPAGNGQTQAKPRIKKPKPRVLMGKVKAD